MPLMIFSEEVLALLSLERISSYMSQHTWQALIANRCKNGSRCPECGKNKRTQAQARKKSCPSFPEESRHPYKFYSQKI